MDSSKEVGHVESQVGRRRRVAVQVIGDRRVTNPRIRLSHLRNAEGNVVETLRLSLEVCGCGYSLARPGVGYAGPSGWYCKRCGQLHTRDGTKAGDGRVDEACLKPDPSLAREFDKRTRVSGDWSTPEDLEAGQSTDERR